MFRCLLFRRTAVSFRRLSSSNVNKDPRGFHYYVFHTVWEFYKKKWLNLTLGVSVLGCLAYVNSPKKLMLRSLEEGKGFDSFNSKDEKADVKREKLCEDLKLILRPKKSMHYAVIVGENGCGKSTAVRQVLSCLEFPRGAIYYKCPENPKDFSTKLLEVLGYGRLSKEQKSPAYETEPMRTFAIIRKLLLSSAKLFKAKHNRPIVLIIDSTDVLANKDPEFLKLLQDFAKNCADEGILRVVFISSCGSALSLLMSRSKWSRAKPPYEVGEISDEEAKLFLIRRGVPSIDVEQAVMNLTGGLFASLNIVVANYMEGKSYDEIVEIFDRKINETMEKIKINMNHSLFKKLMKDKVIGTDEALETELTEDQLQMLLNNNILAVHPNQTYTFHDRHVAVWFSKKVHNS